MPEQVTGLVAAVRDERLTYLRPRCSRTWPPACCRSSATASTGSSSRRATARGGSAIVLAAAKSPARPMKVYDVFGTIPPPTEQDGAGRPRRYATITGRRGQGSGGETYYGYRDDLYQRGRGLLRSPWRRRRRAQRRAVRGLFEDTIQLDEPVALAHLDGDWYESTMTCLTRIAPLLAARRADRARRLLQVVRLPAGGRRVPRRPRGLPARAPDEAPRRPCLTPSRGRRARGARRRGCSRRLAARRREADAATAAARRPPRRRAAPRARALRRGARARPRAGRRRDRRGARPARRRTRPVARWRSPNRCSAIPRRAARTVAARRSSPTDAATSRSRGTHLRELPPDAVARLAPAEYVAVRPRACSRRDAGGVRALVADDPPDVPPRAGTTILAAVFGYGDQELARAVFAVFDRHVGEDVARLARGPSAPRLDAAVGRSRRRLADRSRAAGGPPRLAIMDYGHPGANRASANIGDHIQSIAGLGARRAPPRRAPPRRASWSTCSTTLRRPHAAGVRRDDLDADLEVMAVHRDASMYQAIPEGTWVLCFGWYMHALFTMRHGFPLHRNLRPIFVSFHCNKREPAHPGRGRVPPPPRAGRLPRLDDDPPADLDGRPGLLLRLPDDHDRRRVPRPRRPRRPTRPSPTSTCPRTCPPDARRPTRHSSLTVRRRSFVANAEIALERWTPTGASTPAVVTSRLHCHLPLRSIGVETEFVPANPRRRAVRRPHRHQRPGVRRHPLRPDGQARAHPRPMIAGAPEADVYAAWREPTADDVAAAERELRRAVSCSRPRPSGPARPRAWSARRRPTPRRRRARRTPVDCACSSAQQPRPRRRRAARLAGRARVQAGSPVGARAAGQPRRPARAALPGGDRQLDPAQVRCGKRGAPLGLVLLPGLVPDVERLVVLPTPAVVTADVSELADLELGHTRSPRPPARGPRSSAASASSTRPPTACATARRPRPSCAARRWPGTGSTSTPSASRRWSSISARLRREGFMEEGLQLAQHVPAQRRRDPALPHGPEPGARPGAVGRPCRPARLSAAPACCTGPTPRSRGTTCSRPSASCGIAMP